VRLATWPTTATVLGDDLEHLAHAGRDRETGLAVRDLLCQAVVDHPGAEHVRGLPSDVAAFLVLADADPTRPAGARTSTSAAVASG
jgi:hypothetical protein